MSQPGREVVKGTHFSSSTRIVSTGLGGAYIWVDFILKTIIRLTCQATYPSSASMPRRLAVKRDW